MEPVVHDFLLLVIFLFYFMAIRVRDLLYSTIFLGGGSIALAAVFYMLQAPDIAITQAAVGAGLSTLLFVIAISRTRRVE
ncbi:MAG: hydrogenase subunit MbhD domain-containing protein [Candidatus Hadarchaeales archaeon]